LTTIAPVLSSGLLGDQSRDAYLTDFGKATLSERYLFTGETYQDLFVRVAKAYANDDAHAQRLYDYMSNGWFMPSTPILSNGGTNRGLPISCFLNSVPDSLEGIEATWSENVWLAARGGGIGTYWGDVREIGHDVNGVGKTSGIIPFIKVQDSLTLAISQGSLRRGSAAVYLPIWHPEIEEFIKLRKPTGDQNRRCQNVHHGVVITDAFMEAVVAGTDFALVSPVDGTIVKTVAARDLFNSLLETRVELGEPYLLFIDSVNKASPAVYRHNGLRVKQSNLCSEIMLHTGEDRHGAERTAVCCLASVNAEKFLDWKLDQFFIEDVMSFLDNVLQDFIDRTEGVKGFENARYSAMRERSVGLGVMGFHSFLQSLSVPFEGAMAKVWNMKIFQHLNVQTDAASRFLAQERGSCPDAAELALEERFAHKRAIAPTASISIICQGVSAGIDPILANIYTHKTLSGSYAVKNPHLDRLLRERAVGLKMDAGDHFDEAAWLDEQWLSILEHGGSVQHLDYLLTHEKHVFKTAHEIDQRWIVDHAGDRAPFIDQGQSVNVFLAGDVSKAELVGLHVRAWKRGVKSLYYLRSTAVNRAENLGQSITSDKIDAGKIFAKTITAPVLDQDDECLSCQ
jgi:ribonucleoside-diphosphate reductase alpha chain